MPTQVQKTIRNTRSLHPCSMTGLSVVARDLCMPEQVTSVPRLFGSRLLSARALQFFCPPGGRDPTVSGYRPMECDHRSIKFCTALARRPWHSSPLLPIFVPWLRYHGLRRWVPRHHCRLREICLGLQGFQCQRAITIAALNMRNTLHRACCAFQ
jgi:hypothetical protein